MIPDPYDSHDDPGRQEHYDRHLALRCLPDCPFCAEEEDQWDDGDYEE